MPWWGWTLVGVLTSLIVMAVVWLRRGADLSVALAKTKKDREVEEREIKGEVEKKVGAVESRAESETKEVESRTAAEKEANRAEADREAERLAGDQPELLSRADEIVRRRSGNR